MMEFLDYENLLSDFRELMGMWPAPDLSVRSTFTFISATDLEASLSVSPVVLFHPSHLPKL